MAVHMESASSEAKGKVNADEVEKAAGPEQPRLQQDCKTCQQGFPATSEESDSAELFSDFSDPTGSRSVSLPPPNDPKGCKAGTCRPCGFFLRPSGCSKGAACTFCHDCSLNKFRAVRPAAKDGVAKVVIAL
mmetsp:Transcript_76044/g.183889  ORF Transcript_76044/g.183889 Transcript_76044/m.183889 type:complete len:132 (+) Transcript_76044:136-531(+)